MANITARNPILYNRAENMFIQKGPVADGGANADSPATSIQPGHFVTSSGAFPNQVIKATRDGANFGSIFGWCPDGVRVSTDKLPKSLPTGNTNHYVFDPSQSQFLINITDTSGNVGASGPDGTTVTAGLQYGLKTVVVNSIPIQMLNKDDTTNKVFEVVAFPSERAINQTTADKNPQVLVKIIGTVIQA